MIHRIDDFVFECPEIYQDHPQLISEWLRCLEEYVANYKRLQWWGVEKLPEVDAELRGRAALSVMPKCARFATYEEKYGNL